MKEKIILPSFSTASWNQFIVYYLKPCAISLWIILNAINFDDGGGHQCDDYFGKAFLKLNKYDAWYLLLKQSSHLMLKLKVKNLKHT